MEQPARILCAVDASRPAAATFEQALAMSARSRAQLVLVHAVSKDSRYSWRAVERVAALAALRERAEALNVPVRVRVQQGDTAGVILLHARAQAPDLIVLGSHDPAGFARFRFRSVADRVATGAGCPVLLVPGATTLIAPTFRKLICAMDLASRSPTTAGHAACFVGEMAPDARRRLHSILDTQDRESGGFVTVRSKSDHEILRIAREVNADLIVIGATHRASPRRPRPGSTALRVSRGSPVPVLIFPSVHVTRTLSTLDQASSGGRHSARI